MTVGEGWNPQPVSEGIGKKPCVMIYGVPGARKTRFVGSGEGVLIIRPPTDHTDSIADSDADEIVCGDWSAMFETFANLQQGAGKRYKWVWWDGISLGQDVLLQDVMADALVRKPTRAVNKGGIQVPEFSFDQGEYGINFNRIVKWVGDMVGLAKDGMFGFGITAHPMDWYDPVKQEHMLAPWVQGKNMSEKICGFMNIVAYLQVQKRKDDTPQTVLLTEAEGFYGKDQYNCFPELKNGRSGLISPTLPKLEKLIGGRMEPEKRRKQRPARKTRKPSRRRAA